jgi:hypothetical protein
MFTPLRPRRIFVLVGVQSHMESPLEIDAGYRSQVERQEIRSFRSIRWENLLVMRGVQVGDGTAALAGYDVAANRCNKPALRH